MAEQPTIDFEPRVDRPSPGAFAVAVVALLIVTSLAYSPVFHAGLLGWDDQPTISKNPLLNPPSLDGVAWYWRHSHMHLYVPITYTAWSALATIAHGRLPGDAMWPLPFHAANLAIHLATIAVLVALLRRIGLASAPTLLAATLFALHPLNVEAVAWASGLKDVLCTLLMFSAALAWVGPGDGRRRRVGATIATLLYAIALLTKPTAIITPILAWLLGLAVGRPARASLGRLLPWMILAVPIALIGRAVQPPSNGEVIAFALRPLVAFDAIGFYLAKLAWPALLAVDHGRTPTRLLDGRLSFGHVPIAIGLLLVAALALWRLDRARRRLAVIGVALAVVALAPVLGLVPFDFQAISSVAEHYCYPAMVGIAVVVATIASRSRDTIVCAITVLVVVACVPLTFRQARTWRDDASLFDQVLAANPQSWTAASAFSYTALKENRPADAERWAVRALEENSRYPTAWINLASAQSKLGHDDEAIDTLGRAYGIEPDNAIINLNLGGLLASKGFLKTALPLLQRAADLEPTNAAAHGNLGGALLQTGRPREALEHLNLAVALAPDDRSIRVRRAIALDANGRSAQARQELAAMLSARPDDAEARDALARIDAALKPAPP